VPVLASARSRRLPDLTPGALRTCTSARSRMWRSAMLGSASGIVRHPERRGVSRFPPPAADGTRGRTGREDGAAVGALSSRPFALCQGYCNVRHRPGSAPHVLTHPVRCPWDARAQQAFAVGHGAGPRRAAQVPPSWCRGPSARVPGRASLGGRLRSASQTAHHSSPSPGTFIPPARGLPAPSPDARPRASAQDDGERAAPRRRALQVSWQRPVTPGEGVGHRQRTLDPDTMLMSRPEITPPVHQAGLDGVRFGASNVRSTIALRHPVPPPPPEKTT
jgi:hypothetical protein